MDATHVDRIAKLFAARRSRRAALTQTGTGLAAGALAAVLDARPAAAQGGTPAAAIAGEKPGMLFVQSFRSGGVATKDGGEDGTYTLTLEGGLGQTIYFSDRPERVVGADPTAGFLKGLGFSTDNPPNAALVVEPAPGETEIAVLELFNPTYDETTHTATYDVKVLAEWRDALGVGLTEEPADLAEMAPAFGAAHLFIDDCIDREISCYDNGPVGTFDGAQGFCYNYLMCMPCEPYGHTQPNKCQTYYYWGKKCNDTFDGCHKGGGCTPGVSSDDPWGDGC